MKLVAVLATVLGVASAFAIPAELQERSCIFNGLSCTLPAGANPCCSGNCHAIVCGGDVLTCQPKLTPCIPGDGNGKV